MELVLTKQYVPPKRQTGNSKIEILGQGWNLTEKLDVLNAILSDKRFSYAERVAASTMIVHFHNTTSGDLFPSRKHVTERCGVKKGIAISALRWSDSAT
jgi:hypothetical protein